MAKSTKNKLTLEQQEELISILNKRFEKNKKRHKDLDWKKIEAKLIAQPEKLWSLNEMERTGGEPDIVKYDSKKDSYLFMDCSSESPKDRRSLCYDRASLDARKEIKPSNTVKDMANEMGISLLNEEQYRLLQKLGPFDTKTSSWIETPDSIRKLGGVFLRTSDMITSLYTIMVLHLIMQQEVLEPY